MSKETIFDELETISWTYIVDIQAQLDGWSVGAVTLTDADEVMWDNGALEYNQVFRFLRVKEWVDSMAAGEVPDKLAQFDADFFDGSIGGFGTKMEYLLESRIAAPLWEIRGWRSSRRPQQVPDIIKASHRALVSMHREATRDS